MIHGSHCYKKRFHFAGGLKGYHHLPGLAYLRPGMWHFFGQKDGISRAEVVLIFAHLKVIAAIHHIKNLILVMVNMKRCSSARGQTSLLKYSDAAISVR